MADWVPSREQAKLYAFRAMAHELARQPHAYGVSPDDAAEAVRCVERLDEAMFHAGNLATRTAPQVAIKNQCLAEANALLRRLAAVARAHPGVGPAELGALGLAPRRRPRRYVPAPKTAPQLHIRRFIPGGHEIEIYPSEGAARRGKPADAVAMQLLVVYRPAGADIDDLLTVDAIRCACHLHSVLTRTLCRVTHPDEYYGRMVWYIGCWINARGESGPLSRFTGQTLSRRSDSPLPQAA